MRATKPQPEVSTEERDEEAFREHQRGRLTEREFEAWLNMNGMLAPGWLERERNAWHAALRWDRFAKQLMGEVLNKGE